jgi:menaquinone-specific isochorismate synthase
MTTAPVPREHLRAVTRAADPPDDLLDALGPDSFAWLYDGHGFVTAGVAARVAPADAAALLTSIEHDDRLGRPGTGPLAVGALPFSPDPSATLLVPSRIVGRDAEGRGWVTELEPGLHVPPPPAEPPDSFTVRELTSREHWYGAVEEALAAIGRGDLEKVVLARRVEIEADRPFDTRAVLGRLRSQQPGWFVYSGDGMIGASPELLVRRRGETVESVPMAGTSTASDPAAVERLRASTKDAREHRPVVDAIVAVLEPGCVHLDAVPEPEVAVFSMIAHLFTPIRGVLRAPAPDALGLALAMHPTPAVGGTPTPAALDLLDQLEDGPRGRYAGPVGWVDARGDGEWAVALRGAAIDGARAVLLAGAGIVAGSDPDAEWRETEAKLEPMVRALVRP